jgi:hypothetical protein
VRFAGALLAFGCITALGKAGYADTDPRGPEPPVWVIAPPPPEPPEPEPEGEDGSIPRPKEKLFPWGGDFQLGTLMIQPSLARSLFIGEGVPRTGVERESFRHMGRELGIERPLLVGGELGLHYMRRYFAVGLMGFYAVHPGGAESGVAGRGVTADLVDAGGIYGFGGGVDFAGALPLGHFALRAGGVFGLRAFSIPMTGFQQTTCRSKHGTYPCDEIATTRPDLFFEPRLMADVSFGATGVFFLGAYVGMDALSGAGPTAGLYVGVHAPHSQLEP